MPVQIFLFVCGLLWLIFRKRSYKSTEYYQQTHNPRRLVRQDRGLAGEYAVYGKLRRLRGYGRFLFNLYVPAEHGETTEIDALLLHESGIYVLESKNYAGRICGSETERYWTRTRRSAWGVSEKDHFYNPVLQNQGHIRWLRAYLGDRSLPVYSVVIFGNDCKLKHITSTGETQVVRLKRARSVLRRHAAEVGKQLTPAEIDAIYARLYDLTQADEETRQQHIADVREKRRRYGRRHGWLWRLFHWLFRRRRCPCCGAKLVVRTASRGENAGHKFLGCSNYPHCRYTQDL